jgi:hypothetical protein
VACVRLLAGELFKHARRDSRHEGLVELDSYTPEDLAYFLRAASPEACRDPGLWHRLGRLGLVPEGFNPCKQS